MLLSVLSFGEAALLPVHEPLAHPVAVDAGQVGEVGEHPLVGEQKALARVLQADEKPLFKLHKPYLVYMVDG